MLLPFILAVFFTTSPISNQVLSISRTDFSSVIKVVTAADYCSFLNDVAVKNSDHLYDEKMESDAKTAFILRQGQPGDYCYVVIAGCEDMPSFYVNEVAQKAYCEWAGVTSPVISKESFFASNKREFFITNVSNPLCLLSINKEVSSWKSEVAKDLLIAAGSIALFEGARGAVNYYRPEEVSDHLERERIKESRGLVKEADHAGNQADDLSSKSLADLQRSQEDGGLTREQREHLEDLSAISKADGLQAEAAKKRLLRKAQKTEESEREKNGEGRSQRLESFDQRRTAMAAFGEIYKEASLLELKVERSLLEHSKNLLLLEKYLTEEAQIHHADELLHYKSQGHEGDSLQEDFKQVRSAIDSSKKLLQHIRNLKQDVCAGRGIRLSEFLSNEKREKASSKFDTTLQKVTSAFQPEVINWSYIFDKAKQFIGEDKKEREVSLNQAQQAEAKEQNDVKVAEAQTRKSFLSALFNQDRIEQGKKEAKEAKTRTTQAIYALKAANDVEANATKKYEKVLPSFTVAEQELQKAWSVLHLTEEQFIKADWLKDFTEAYTGEISLNGQKGIEKLGILLNKVRRDVATVESNFDQTMEAIQKSFDAVSDDANKMASNTLRLVASQLKKNETMINSDEYKEKTIEEILDDAQESANALNNGAPSEEDANDHRNKLEDAMAALAKALENI